MLELFISFIIIENIDNRKEYACENNRTIEYFFSKNKARIKNPIAKDSGGENKDLYITTVDNDAIKDSKKAISILHNFFNNKNRIIIDKEDNKDGSNLTAI